MGKPIAFHTNPNDDEPDDGYYHVYLCEFCGLYTNKLYRHLIKKYGLPANHFMRPRIRPRNLSLEF